MNDLNADESLLTDLAEEFAVRRRAGERVSVEEYAGRHPDRANEVRAVLSAVVVLEKGKSLLGTTPLRPSQLEPAVSDRVGDYRLVRELGRGGMGIVYEAVHTTLGRRVALKLLPAQAVPDANRRSRFRREAQAAARLHHTNIVPVYEAGEIDGRCFYAMQLISGRGLDGVIAESVDTPARPVGSCDSEVTLLGKRVPTAQTPDHANEPPRQTDGPVSPSAVLPEGSRSPREWVRHVTRIGLQVADALAHAHAHGVVHRDIKPSNLLLDDEGVVWVTDFGVAKVLEERDLTGPGEMVGTLRYMAPERFSGLSDARGDVYSLGVTLYELLTLRPAFPDSSPLQMMRLVSDADGVAPRKWNPAVPRDLDTVVRKATARNPAHRYQTAGELADDLRRVLDDRPVRARRIGFAERSWRWCRRNPALATATTAAVVLLVAVSAVSLAAVVQSESASREVARANAELENALAAETAQRADAERTAALTLGAMSRTYARLAPTRGATSPPTNDGTELHPPPGTVAPEIVPILEDLLATYEQIAGSAERFPALRTQAAEAYHRIGDIGRRLGRHEAAVAAYTAAVERYGEPTAADGVAARVRMAQACNDLGLVLKSLQRLDESEAAHNRAVRLLTAPPAAITARPECRFELAWAYYALGRRDVFQSAPLSQKFNRGPFLPSKTSGPSADLRAEAPPPRRVNLGWRAIDLLESLTYEFPNAPEYRHLLACCYRDLPPVPPGSKGGPAQAVELLRQLAREFPQVPEYLYDLCGALAHPVPGDRPGAFTPASRANLEEAIRVSGELAARYPSVPEYTSAQARYLDRLGRKLLEMGQPADALLFHRKAVGLQSRLVQQHPDAVTYATWLGLMEHALGRELSAAGEWAEARSQMTSGITRVEAAWRKETRLDGLRTFLGMAYASLADAHERSGDAGLATEARRKAGEFERGGRDSPPGPRGGLRH